MANQRIIRRCKENGSIYHVVTRTVNKEFLWDDFAKEILRKQIRKVAAFCGVEVLAYCIMSNHFHLLVRVISNKSEVLDNQMLLDRCRHFYSHRKDTLVLAELEAGLLHPDPDEQLAARTKLLARMDDLSMFMKILKQRFSIWYNKTHQRWGTHWGERFQSLLVQPSRTALMAVAAYIALNPVRAGLCQDPKGYRYSSYTEAIIGNPKAREGISHVTNNRDSAQALCDFRQYIHAIGILPKKNGEGAAIDPAIARQVLQKEGRLSSSEVWKTKMKFFSEGVAIGSTAFLEQLLIDATIRRTSRTRPRPLPILTDDSLNSLR